MSERTMPDAAGPAPVPLTAVALDDRVELEALPARAGEPPRRPYARVLDDPEGRRVHVFRFGAVVVEGAESTVDAAIARVEGITGRRALPETQDTWTIRVAADLAGEGQRVGWDQVVVPELSPERLAAIALLLGQSAALERYEREADRLLEECAAVAQGLTRTGRPPPRSRTMVRRLGRIAARRLELARWFFLVDRPEETWEQPAVAALYDALFRALELEERHRGMLHKLDAAAGGLRTTVDLWHARWSHWLEWAIVLLIVADLVLVLVRPR